jgi:hydroxymethylglutaryl-CoA reductase
MPKGEMKDLMKGFSKLSRAERFDRLKEMGALTNEDVKYLNAGGIQDLELAEKFIENVIGYFQIPLGVATNFRIDGVDHAIPMAVEETSIIAAASKTAKWIKDSAGSISTESIGQLIIGQIQVARVADFAKFQIQIEANKTEFINMANREVAHGLVDRGGGVSDIHVRQVARGDGADMAVIHVLMDPCDAMGANIMNQVCEYLKGPVQEITGQEVTMCILSNLVDTKLTRARVTMKIDEETGLAIEEASLFAQQDPYRAATNNKGVLNGIDPILVATGNDWRAVEAGVHAYASRDGQYRSITKWVYHNGELHGELTAPIVVGTVGGVTRLHPTAKMCLKMLNVKNASELSRVCAAVGLVQNLGALRALTTVGIIEGHMKLHIKNLTLGAGALEREAPFVQKRLEEILMLRKRISLHNAIEVLRELRASGTAL